MPIASSDEEKGEDSEMTKFKKEGDTLEEILLTSAKEAPWHGGICAFEGCQTHAPKWYPSHDAFLCPKHVKENLARKLSEVSPEKKLLDSAKLKKKHIPKKNVFYIGIGER